MPMSRPTKRNHTNEPLLNSPDDWEIWNFYLEHCAANEHALEFLTGEKVPAEKPELPSLARFQVPTGQGDTTTREARDIGELTKEQVKSYWTEWYLYKLLNANYDRDSNAIKEVRQFILRTVSERYLFTCCEPCSSLATWYRELESRAGLETKLLGNR